MRLLTTNLNFQEVSPYIKKLVDILFKSIPAGFGGHGFLKTNKEELKKNTEEGVPYLIRAKGVGWEKDIERIEEKGKINAADFSLVSDKAIERGLFQLATLGSGNHYLEIQKVEEIIDSVTASRFGITSLGQITVMIHCGSRGFGHQVCSDYLKIFEKHQDEFKIEIKDRQLVSAPIKSLYGKNYLGAMAAAANFAFVNREAITHRVRQVFEKVFRQSAEKLEMNLVYDVAHNIGKFEGDYLIHRKGATRSFPETPAIIGGSMEIGSYLLLGTDEALKKSYGSTAHGSGRTMSRSHAKKIFYGKKLFEEMKKQGIYVRSASMAGLAEEAGSAYKNIADVVKSVSLVGLSKPVAYFKPIGNIKG
jgi:tRNA-splicing ligase RtcB